MIIPAKDWNRSVYQLSKQCFIGMMITANRWNRLFAWALYVSARSIKIKFQISDFDT